MPSPTPEFYNELIERLGSEDAALEYLGLWSNAIQNGEEIPELPEHPRDRFTCPMPLTP